ncbi:Amidohydrolase [Granulicella rosea]|uniref:Amidohydrolase n=1 Tax=Granulicella rosea TaxID=474952 RepID=A0A239MIJ5_9BACT|nr:amidohydrolase family protein [Granulicella rosea]SNT41924.1 Amidohydrolase [Granulicella rosea]
MSAVNATEDKFVALVNATTSVDLRLSDFHPRSCLRTPVHHIERARFPVIDYHNHLDSTDPYEVLAIMDQTNVEHCVNITMQTDRTALEIMDRFHNAAPTRFSSIGWMDWSGIDRADFVQLTIDRLERMVEHGAVGIKFWKDLGLTHRDAQGNLLRIDDERFTPIFEACGKLGLPVMFHTADPSAFFEPIDPTNERFEELAAHPDWGFSTASVTKRQLLDQRNRVIARHPEITFVGAHCAESGEDLAYLAEQLDALPNLLIDISARTPELGRQPYSARRFFLKYADRILFGTDLLPELDMYRQYFRFLETDDEYFEYPSHASRQGRWNIYGLYLPDDVLLKVYRENALKLLPKLR